MRNIIKKDFLKQMKITKIREVKTPTRGTECSAGLDFYVPKGFNLEYRAAKIYDKEIYEHDKL